MSTRGHRFDLMTDYCVVCGCGRQQTIDYNVRCIDLSTNITAISHRRAQMLGKFDDGQRDKKLRSSLEDNNSTTTRDSES